MSYTETLSRLLLGNGEPNMHISVLVDINFQAYTIPDNVFICLLIVPSCKCSDAALVPLDSTYSAIV